MRIGQAGKILGVTPQTVRKYVRSGLLTGGKNKAGQYTFEMKDLEEFLGRAVEKEELLGFYIRSSSGQQASLKTQEKLLAEKFGKPVKIFKDKASGLRDDRKGLNSLIAAIQKGEINIVAITNKDRLTRFGYKYLETLFSQNSTEILILNSEETKTPNEELMQDFMSLIASFAGKFYRLRGYEQQKTLLKIATSELETKIND